MKFEELRPGARFQLHSDGPIYIKLARISVTYTEDLEYGDEPYDAIESDTGKPLYTHTTAGATVLVCA